jgi:hypothetical protein
MGRSVWFDEEENWSVVIVESFLSCCLVLFINFNVNVFCWLCLYLWFL